MMNAFVRVCAAVGLVVCLAGCPCVTPPPPEVVVPQVYSGQVDSLGTFGGVLADDVLDAFNIPGGGVSTILPVIMPGEAVHTLDTAQVEAVRAAFANLQPVALLEATLEDIVAINTLLGTGLTFTLAEGYDYAEVYALDFEDDYALFQWVQYAPPPSDDGEDDLASQQTRRVNALVAWMELNGERLAEPDAQEAAKNFEEAAKGADLTQLTQGFHDQTNFWQSGNNYQILHYICACHSLDTGDDWFYIEQRGSIAASGAYEGKKQWSYCNDLSGWYYTCTVQGEVVQHYLGSVEFNSSVNGFENNVAQVTMTESSPETANNTETITSGFTWNLGGNLAFGEAGATGTVEGGVTVERMDEVSIKDCEVKNLQNDRGNNVHWIYEFKRCTASNPLYYAAVSDPPNLAVTSFQPLNKWTWRMSSGPRQQSASFRVNFKTILVSTKGHIDFLFAAHPTHDYSWTAEKAFDVCLPYPPTSAD